MEETAKYANTSMLMSSESQDFQWALRINEAITYNFTISLVCTGVCLNYLVMMGWRKSSIRPMAFMFRALAGTDMSFLIGFCLFYIVPSDWIVEPVFRDVAFLSRNIVVHVTLLMSFLCWAELVFPKQYRASSKTLELHADVALALIINYCAVLRFLLNLNKMFPADPEKPWAFTEASLKHVVLTLPLVLQAAFATHVMLITRKISQWEGQMKLQPKLKIMKSSVQKRQLTVVVVIVILSTVTTYAVVATASTVFKLTPTKASTKHVVAACANLLAVFSASINFFFYWSFVPEFREVVRQRFCGQETKADQSNLVKPNLKPSTTLLSSVAHASKDPVTSSDVATKAEECPVSKKDSGTDSKGSPARICFAMIKAQSSVIEPKKRSVSPRPKQEPEKPIQPRMRKTGALRWARLKSP